MRKLAVVLLPSWPPLCCHEACTSWPSSYRPSPFSSHLQSSIPRHRPLTLHHGPASLQSLANIIIFCLWMKILIPSSRSSLAFFKSSDPRSSVTSTLSIQLATPATCSTTWSMNADCISLPFFLKVYRWASFLSIRSVRTPFGFLAPSVPSLLTLGARFGVLLGSGVRPGVPLLGLA